MGRGEETRGKAERIEKERMRCYERRRLTRGDVCESRRL
jgi:hypothetical protein